MTPAEFRAIRQSLGLSQTGLAEAIHRRCPGTPPMSIVRRIWAWERGENPIAWYGAALIRLVAEGQSSGAPEPPDRMDRQKLATPPIPVIR